MGKNRKDFLKVRSTPAGDSLVLLFYESDFIRSRINPATQGGNALKMDGIRELACGYQESISTQLFDPSMSALLNLRKQNF